MGRHLRVDWSNDGPSKDQPGGNQQSGGADSGAQVANGVNPSPSQSAPLPTLPPGVDLPPGVTCPDAISNTLKTIHPPQLLDTLSQMKNLVDTSPGMATQLLSQAPQLSYALFQALLLLGLVDTQMLTQVVQQTAAPQPPPQPQAPPIPPQNFQQPPMPPQLSQPQFQPMQTATPPMAQPQYQAPQAGFNAGGQSNAIQQVLAMTQEQIDRYPPDQRNALMALRAQAAAGGYR